MIDHEQRRQRLGASELAATLGISPYMTAWQVQQEKLGKIELWEGAEWTEAGNDYENALLDIAERELGPFTRQFRAEHKSLPLAATCDGAKLLDTGSCVIEAKTTGLVGPVQGAWGDAGSDEIPDYYLVQVHAQLMCTQADVAYLYALIAGRGTVRFEIEPSPSIHEMLGNHVADWWERHVVQQQPVPMQSLPNLEVVKRLRKVPNKTIALPPEVAQYVDDWQGVNELRLSTEKAEKNLQAKVLLALGDAECGVLSDGRRLEYFEIQRKGYEVKPTKYRQLKVKTE